jgi:hypothetical protein
MSPAPSAKWSSAIPVGFATPYKTKANGCHDAEGGDFLTPVAKASWCCTSPGDFQSLSQERLCNSGESVSGAKHFSIGDRPDEGSKHFSIGDRPDESSNVISNDPSHQLGEVARSLETAAAALRNVASPGFSLEATASYLDGISKSRLLQSPWRDSWGADDASNICIRTKSSSERCQSRLSDEALSHTRDDAPLERLARENEALRGALGNAVRKLAELEGEKERFMSEDVFDLVNSLCRDSTGGAPDSQVLYGLSEDCIKK